MSFSNIVCVGEKKMSRLMKLVIVCLVVVFQGVAISAVTEFADDMTTDTNWRTNAALESDSEYGTDGYVLYGYGTDSYTGSGGYDATQANSENLYSLPGYITNVLPDVNHNLWGGDGNYGILENPEDSGTHNAAVLLVDEVTQPLTLTIQRATSQAFRLTLIIAGGNGGNRLGDIQSVTIDAGSTGLVTTTHTGLSTVGVGYKSFDIGAGTDDIVVTIDRGGDGDNTHLTGLAFDSDAGNAAVNPFPADKQNKITTDVMLSWEVIDPVESQTVYFGTARTS
jgi:hypothetical protein